MLETIKIVKCDNGYYVESNTTRSENEAHYCSNLKGVVAYLYKTFEGTIKMSKEQAEALKGVLPRLLTKAAKDAAQRNQ